MRSLLVALFAVVISLPLLAQCGFRVDPVAESNWYSEEGWPTPGMDQRQWIPVNITMDEKPQPLHEGFTVSAIALPHNSHATFPGTLFDEGGVHKKLRSQTMLLFALYRWSFNGKPYAYSYQLAPTDVACSFTMDLIDDRGDGKFRKLTLPGHVVLPRRMDPPPLPKWTSGPAA
ncbi:hypothetical protein [Candidatus Korobacter versatilis]|uniref:hypothetical protein n=1 Tax=Candidatus Korobacter versatilis TaxID=658062 RepID=UPI0011D1104A|nr:hypothetical protein [Candidatus Koribacter versatilis]